MPLCKYFHHKGLKKHPVATNARYSITHTYMHASVRTLHCKFSAYVMSFIGAIAMRLNVVFNVNFAFLYTPVFGFVCVLLHCKSATASS